MAFGVTSSRFPIVRTAESSVGPGQYVQALKVFVKRSVSVETQKRKAGVFINSYAHQTRKGEQNAGARAVFHRISQKEASEEISGAPSDFRYY